MAFEYRLYFTFEYKIGIVHFKGQFELLKIGHLML